MASAAVSLLISTSYFPIALSSYMGPAVIGIAIGAALAAVVQKASTLPSYLETTITALRQNMHDEQQQQQQQTSKAAVVVQSTDFSQRLTAPRLSPRHFAVRRSSSAPHLLGNQPASPCSSLSSSALSSSSYFVNSRHRINRAPSRRRKHAALGSVLEKKQQQQQIPPL